MDYNQNIVGRKYEQDILQACMESPKAEFIAVYGRRRIGKTFWLLWVFRQSPPEKRKYTIKMNKKSFFPLLSLQITVSLHPKLQFLYIY